jgi:DNA processing protein
MSTREWIALNSVNGLGPVRIKHLIDHYGSAEEVFKRPAAELRLPEACCAGLSDKTLFDRADAQLTLAEKGGVSVLTPASDNFPAYLREIFAPPPVLFVKGDLSVFSQHACAVVGTRMPTPYGKNMAAAITRELVERGLVIVSGLARGIDTIAHQTCVDAGGRTVAVLGCGIDTLPSYRTTPLVEKIQENGVVVSEFPMGTLPLPYNFPRRNRIISGLSAGVLVVEGGERSGALITAHFALQQGRDVFAVPGPVTSAQSAGTFNLIKDGAIPAKSGRDIADALSFIDNPHLKTGVASGLVIGAPLSLLTDTERTVYDLLSGTGRRVDELAEASGRTVMQLFDVLLALELKGLARCSSGGLYARP